MLKAFEINGYTFTPTGKKVSVRKSDYYVGLGGKFTYGLLNEWIVRGPGITSLSMPDAWRVYTKSRCTRADLIDYIQHVFKVQIVEDK